jgi:hypothetical protein
MLSLADCLKSRYVMWKSLVDAGVTLPRASAACTALFGPLSPEPELEHDDDEGWDDAHTRELGPPPGDDDFRPAADEPAYEPSEQDWADYTAWLDRYDVLARIAEAEEEAFARMVGR